MAKTTVTVCDECERVGEPTHSYAITRDGSSRVVVDLCAEHGEELELCIERSLSRHPVKKAAPRKAVTSGSSRARKVQVTSLADIEKLKKK